MNSLHNLTFYRYGISAVLFLILTSGLMGQSKIKMQLIDSLSNDGIEFAIVSLSQAGKEQVYKHCESDSCGCAEFLNVPYGKYVLKTNHLNYETISKEITVNKDVTDLGKVLVSEKANTMSAVVVKAVANPVTIKKDTVEFNASSFSVAEGDALEKLLKKLPGLEVDNKGKITYNGKSINKILVDGKNFFLSDPQALTANLPAKIVDKVSVIDRKSEQSRFSGVDDGNEETIIDLSVKKDFKKGLFGNATAGYGTRDAYTGNIFTAKFDKNTNFGITAMTTNVSAGMYMGGKATSTMFGVNGNTELNKGKVTIGGSYNYSGMDSESGSKSERQTFLEDSSFIYNQLATGLSKSKYNRFNIDLGWKPSEKVMLTFRPSFNISNQSSANSSKYTTNGACGTPINEGYSNNYSEGLSKSASGSMLFAYRFDKPRRTFSINTDFDMSNGDNDGYNQSRTIKYNDAGLSETDSVKQKSNTINDSYNIGLRASYTEPLASKYILELAYNLRYGIRNSDKSTYNWNSVTEMYDIKDDVYSNYYEDISFNQNYDINLKKDDKNFDYRIGFSLQPSYTKSTGTGRDYSNSIVNYAPSLSLNYTLNKSTNLKIDYRGISSQPSLSQMQPVPDNSNPLYIRLGNPDLLTGFRNNLNIILRTNKREKMRSAEIRVSGGYNKNCISNISAYGNGGIQYSIPINTDATYNGSFGLVYNSPLITKKLFMYLNSSVSLNNSISYTAIAEVDPEADPSDLSIDNFKNITKNFTDNLSVSNSAQLTYRLEKIDLSVEGNISYRNAWYTIIKKSNPETWTYSANADLRLYLSPDFNVSTTINFNASNGYGSERDKPYTIMNGEINKGLFKNKFALKLTMYDILNQAKGINRTTTENYIEDTESIIQKQYFLLSLTYKFGKFPGGRFMGNRGERGPHRNYSSVTPAA